MANMSKVAQIIDLSLKFDTQGNFFISGKSTLKDHLESTFVRKENKAKRLVKNTSAQVSQCMAAEKMVLFDQPYFLDPPVLAEMDKITNLCDSSYEGKPILTKQSQAQYRAAGIHPQCRSGIGYVWQAEAAKLPGHNKTLLSKSVYCHFSPQEHDDDDNMSQQHTDIINEEKFSSLFVTYVQKIPMNDLRKRIDEKVKQFAEEVSKMEKNKNGSMSSFIRTITNYALLSAAFELWTEKVGWPIDERAKWNEELNDYFISICIPKIVQKLNQVDFDDGKIPPRMNIGTVDLQTTLESLIENSDERSFHSTFTFDVDCFIISNDLLKYFHKLDIKESFKKTIEKPKIYFLNKISEEVYFKRSNTIYGTFTRKKGLCVFWTSMPSDLIEKITAKLNSFGIEFTDSSDIKSATQAFYDKRYNVQKEADQTTPKETEEADKTMPEETEEADENQTTPQKKANQTTPGKGTTANPIAGPSTPHSSIKRTMGSVMNWKTKKTPLGKRILDGEDKPNDIKKVKRLGKCSSSDDGTNSSSHEDPVEKASGSGL
jgi:hypothetical protein